MIGRISRPPSDLRRSSRCAPNDAPRNHRERLHTRVRVRVSRIAFDAAPVTNTNITVEEVRDSTWLEKTGAPVRGDGTLPALQSEALVGMPRCSTHLRRNPFYYGVGA